MSSNAEILGSLSDKGLVDASLLGAAFEVVHPKHVLPEKFETVGFLA
jgi:hypothetical protein